MSDIGELIDKVLINGLDDWVPLAGVVGIARLSCHDERESVKDATTHLVRQLIADGWAIPGDIADGGFRPWTASNDESISSILNHLQANRWNDSINSYAWFDNTPKGDQRARAAEARGVEP